MYLIMVYDVNEVRVSKVLKVARRYLNWIQNSVLEGEITQAKFLKLKSDLKRVIKENEDSIIFYKLRTTRYLDKEGMGVEKALEGQII
mgnify:CR=1 FL=1